MMLTSSKGGDKAMTKKLKTSVLVVGFLLTCSFAGAGLFAHLFGAEWNTMLAGYLTGSVFAGAMLRSLG
jgi:hypothetical protein